MNPESSSGRPEDKCGLFSIENYCGKHTAAELAYSGLVALQHRGQESAGMAFCDAGSVVVLKGMGLVTQVFPRGILSSCQANSILGHVRYSTTGSSNLANAQPLVARSADGYFLAVAHNGNLTNDHQLRQELLAEGHIFHATTDSEILLAYLFRYRRLGLVEAITRAMTLFRGAFSAVVMDGEKIAAFRDPHGFRPLVIGRLGEANIFASETCALDTVSATTIREVQPGEIVVSEKGRLSSVNTGACSRQAFCIFEYLYFARPDSNFGGKNVHLVRKAIGARLACRSLATDLDLVAPSPDSGISAAMGLAETMALPFEWAIFRNPYLGRTFIEPTSSEREIAARLKYSPISSIVKGKRVALVDDSLVRGTTARQITALLKKAGASAVHFFIAAPPYRYPCYYGIDIPVATELAVSGKELATLAAFIGADSVTFAALDDLYAALDDGAGGYCTACFDGSYPENSLLAVIS